MALLFSHHLTLHSSSLSSPCAWSQCCTFSGHFGFKFFTFHLFILSLPLTFTQSPTLSLRPPAPFHLLPLLLLFSSLLSFSSFFFRAFPFLLQDLKLALRVAERAARNVPFNGNISVERLRLLERLQASPTELFLVTKVRSVMVWKLLESQPALPLPGRGASTALVAMKRKAHQREKRDGGGGAGLNPSSIL